MKVRRHLDRLEPMILTPLKQVRGDDWHRAPPDKWSLAQALSHLAISTDIVAGGFERRAGRTDMKRRATPKQRLLRHVILVGKLPAPREIPEAAYPEERPDPELAKAQFRMGVQRFIRLVEEWPRRDRENIFVAHPVLGDLNVPEWARFFYLHCRHYEHKIKMHLRWLHDTR